MIKHSHHFFIVHHNDLYLNPSPKILAAKEYKISYKQNKKLKNLDSIY